jgi:glycosyltransferase involved in cell wall biosynthesis
MKLACVVQRYGPEVVGGSESHCRTIAEQLAAHHDVTVLTSCATDYLSWKNTYPPGESAIGPVRVLRFPVDRPRNTHNFAELNNIIASGRATPDDEAEWFRENGPQVAGLLEHLQAHGREYDRVLFWTYRYYPSYFGVPLVRDRAILVPTAEEDPAIWLRSLPEFFTLPRGYVFLTPEEADLVRSRADGPLPPSCVIGTGLAPAESGVIESGRPGPPKGGHYQQVPAGPFVLYLGRVDPNKGCETLLRYFQEFVAREGTRVQLVLAGPVFMPMPTHPAIVSLGFVDEATRARLLDSALALVVPSPYESLCIALLEGWNHSLPALVNGRCRVLKGQVLRADGGLFYSNATEFVTALRELLDRPDLARQIGRQGLEYVNQHYRWPTVMHTLETFLASS